MCGIAGLFLRNSPCDPAVLERMRDILTHRGPDDSGSFICGSLGLGHRRLSIIDLSGGHQPMTTEDGRLTIVYNGEIYNYRELRQELERDGFRFSTKSDTEVILQLHAHCGDEAVCRLNGMFAYAIWDETRRRLLLARDRAGIKPLYYASTASGVAFASEIKSLFESGIIRPQMDVSRVGEYLTFRQIAGAESLFLGVRSLMPGHTMSIVDGSANEPVAFWKRNPSVRFKGSFQDAVEELDGILGTAIERQMIADVPLGTFCSGGIDSSLVTAIASRKASQPVNTYSVGFDDREFDESEFARLAAKECGSIHHELRVTEAEYADALPRLVWHHDLPLNFANSVHIFAVSQLARHDVKVVLTGEGADEMFGGYPRYHIARLNIPLSRLPSPLRWGIGALLSQMPDRRVRRLGKFAEADPVDVILFNNATAELQSVRRLFKGPGNEWFSARRGIAASALANATDPLSAVCAFDFETYLISILDRQDKMSMATSIESRVPLLDNEVIDFATKLPAGYRQTHFSRKRVLKKLALRYLPSKIVDRRKSGFGVPIAYWFAGSGPMAGLMREALESELVADLVKVNVLSEFAREHVNHTTDHSDLLWAAVNLYLWRQAFKL